MVGSVFRPRTLGCIVLVGLSACVVRLTDRNSPAQAGAVTGAPADCSAIQVLPGGAPGGDAAPKFVGRFNFKNPDEPGFDWSGNYITVRFTGTDHVTARLAIQGDLYPEDQLFEFILDDKPPEVRRITVQTNGAGVPTNAPLEDYEIVGLDPAAAHELTIYKNTEAQKGAVTFKGFNLYENGKLLPPTRRARRIEFIGDSITCGYGDEGANATCPFEVKVRDATDANGNVLFRKPGVPYVVSVPVTENQFLSYTALAARELDADAVTVCWSGKGVLLNFKERQVVVNGQLVDEPDTRTTVPQLWNGRTIASDSSNDLKWDFAKEKPEEIPQVVVVNLGTNDFARDTFPPPKDPTDPNSLPGDNEPDHDLDDPAIYQKFRDAYVDFVKNIRAHRPDAHIFLSVPPMLSDQYPLDRARSRLRETLQYVASQVDAKVYQMDLVEMGFRYGLGCDYHPNLEVHRIMAQQLVDAIRSKTCWTR